MCDYSLMGVPNRLAVEGEELVVHRFPTNSLGLISPDNLVPKREQTETGVSGVWGILRKLFSSENCDPIVAVCIPPGTRLAMHDIPAHLRNYLKVSSDEEVTFTQTTAAAYAHRDAVRFKNGCEVHLQSLTVGQRVRVLSLSTEEIVEHPERQTVKGY
jgi:hypothetical protein